MSGGGGTSMLAEWLVRLAVLGAAVWMAYHVLFGIRSDFIIRFRHGRARFRGRFPLAHQRDVEQFLREAFGPARRVTITGCVREGRMTFQFNGTLNPSEKQRIRNFLLAQR